MLRTESAPRSTLDIAPASLDLADAHFSAIAYIEEHLFEPLTVEDIAGHAGFSPSRFTRGFTRLQGESPMAYVRGRRLETAMRRMLADPDVRLLDLALDCGFESQEAFTRAFTRAFGRTPGRFKAEGGPLVRRRKPRHAAPEIEQRVIDLPKTILVGLGKKFTPARFGEMRGLWLDVIGRTGRRDVDRYGVFRRLYCSDGGFDFLAAVKLEPGRQAPEGMETLELAPRRYLVFRHLLRAGDIHPQMTAARELIWSSAGYAIAAAPFFQHYRADLSSGGGWIDHYFPIDEQQAAESGREAISFYRSIPCERG